MSPLVPMVPVLLSTPRVPLSGSSSVHWAWLAHLLLSTSVSALSVSLPRLPYLPALTCAPSPFSEFLVQLLRHLGQSTRSGRRLPTNVRLTKRWTPSTVSSQNSAFSPYFLKIDGSIRIRIRLCRSYPRRIHWHWLCSTQVNSSSILSFFQPFWKSTSGLSGVSWSHPLHSSSSLIIIASCLRLTQRQEFRMEF